MAKLGPKMAQLGPITAKLEPKMAELGPQNGQVGSQIDQVFFFKVFFSIVDLGKSEDSEFRDKNFFQLGPQGYFGAPVGTPRVFSQKASP